MRPLTYPGYTKKTGSINVYCLLTISKELHVCVRQFPGDKIHIDRMNRFLTQCNVFLEFRS